MALKLWDSSALKVKYNTLSGKPTCDCCDDGFDPGIPCPVCIGIMPDTIVSTVSGFSNKGCVERGQRSYIIGLNEATVNDTHILSQGPAFPDWRSSCAWSKTIDVSVQGVTMRFYESVTGGLPNPNCIGSYVTFTIDTLVVSVGFSNIGRNAFFSVRAQVSAVDTTGMNIILMKMDNLLNTCDRGEDSLWEPFNPNVFWQPWSIGTLVTSKP